MILIIGGCGYVGTALYDHLMGFGLEIDTVDLEWFGKTNSLNIVDDYFNLDKEFLKKYSTIILAAGHSSVKMCEGKPVESYKNNVVNFIELLDKIDEQKLIYFSSSSVYDSLHSAKENARLNEPRNYYDLTKREIDYYALLSNKNVFGLRPGTVNGFSRNLRTDVMLNKMYFFAKEYNYIEASNVESARAILDIEDLCYAVELLCRTNKRGPEIYNLASFNAKVSDIALIAAEILDVDILYRKGFPSYDFSIDYNKFMSYFPYIPKSTKEAVIENILSGLEDNVHYLQGLRDTIDYSRSC